MGEMDRGVVAMKIIRKGVFETNSSSTHCICISKQNVGKFPKSIHFDIGEWGWENGTLTGAEKADYLYTGLLCLERLDDIRMVENWLSEEGVSCTFHEPTWAYYGKNNEHKYLSNGGIDHGSELDSFLDAIMSSKDRLLRYLFNDDSCVYTGNDNSSDEYGLCNSADEVVYNYDLNESIPNPNHRPDKFEYFEKGN